MAIESMSGGEAVNKKNVSVAEAKQTLSDLLGRVAYGGETITITRRGRAVARLVPVDKGGDRQHLADAKGWLPADDRFFEIINRVIANRSKHKPRVLRKK